MHYKLFDLGPLPVYTYGLCIAIGILAAFYIADKRGKKMGIDVSKLDSITLWILIGGFAGSKLLYWLTRIQDIMKDPSILTNLSDGWVVYGGILGGIAAGWIYCHIKGLNFWEFFDLIIPEVALAQGFGRLGCFFAGCCYGIEVHDWYGLTFPEGGLAPAGIPLFPTQLLSSLYDFILFFVLIALAKKKKFNGELGGWYLIFYSIGRFIIEFFRGDMIRGGFMGLSTSQIISIFTFLAGVAILVIGRKMIQKKKESLSRN